MASPPLRSHCWRRLGPSWGSNFSCHLRSLPRLRASAAGLRFLNPPHFFFNPPFSIFPSHGRHRDSCGTLSSLGDGNSAPHHCSLTCRGRLELTVPPSAVFGSSASFSLFHPQPHIPSLSTPSASPSPSPPSPSLPSPHSPFPSPPPPVGCGKVHSQAAGSHESLTYDFLVPMNKDLRLQIPNVTWLFNVLCSVNLFLNLLFT